MVLTTSRVYISLLVALDAIGDADGAESKDASVVQFAAVDDIIHVYGPRQLVVHGKLVTVAGAGVGLNRPRVRDVQQLVVRAEAEAVAFDKAVGDHPALFCFWVEPVNLRREHRGRSEALVVTVVGVGEPYLPCLVVDDDVVDRVEVAAVKVVDERFGFRRHRIDVDQARRGVAVALGAVQHTILVVARAVRLYHFGKV